MCLDKYRFDTDLHAGHGQQGVLAGEISPGVLEIKCPFNRGRPTAAAPPKQPPWYYMPQVCNWSGCHTLSTPTHACAAGRLPGALHFLCR